MQFYLFAEATEGIDEQAQTTLGRSVLESPAVVEAQSQILAGPERTHQEPSEHRGR